MAVLVDQHILKLDVPVNDPLRMNVLQALADVGKPPHGLCLGNFTSSAYIFKRFRLARGAPYEIHNVVRRTTQLINAQFMDMHQSQMIQSRKDLRFGKKTLLQELPIAMIKSKGLQRQMRLIIVGNNLIDTSHSAMSDFTDNAKLSYVISG